MSKRNLSKRNLVARALMRIAALLDPNSVLDIQYEAFCDWCEDQGLKRRKRNDRDHYAVYENSFGAVRFQCEEFLQDTLCVRANPLDGNRMEAGKKWEFAEKDDAADVKRRLADFGADLGLPNLLKMTMSWDDYMDRERDRCAQAYKRLPGVKDVKCIDYDQTVYGQVVRYELKLDLDWKGFDGVRDFYGLGDKFTRSLENAYPFSVFSCLKMPRRKDDGTWDTDRGIVDVGLYDELSH